MVGFAMIFIANKKRRKIVPEKGNICPTQKKNWNFAVYPLDFVILNGKSRSKFYALQNQRFLREAVILGQKFGSFRK